MLVINSEKEYEEESNNLNSFIEHPLYGELPEHEQTYEETVAALDKWRKENPI
ncbi:hypothetical protein AB4394_07545 [Vibrio lentus]